MENIILTKDIIKKSKLLNKVTHYESKIYLLNDIIYKVLFKEYRTEMRQEAIKRLSSIDNPNYLSALSILMDTNNNFCGCTLPYLKDFINLSSYLNHYQIDLDKRQDLCYSLCNNIDYLESNSLLFNDIYLDNIMVNPNDNNLNYKLIDLDSCLLKDKILINSYDSIKKHTNYDLAQVIFFILLNFNFNFDDMNNDVLYKIYKKSNNKQKEFLNKAIYREGNYVDLRDYIDEFSEEYLEECKLKLSI